MHAPEDRKQEMLTLVVGFGLVITIVAFFVVKNTITRNQRLADSGRAVTAVATDTIPLLDPKEGLKKTQTTTPPKILDFRDGASYDVAHIPGSVSVALDNIPTLGLAEGSEALIITSNDQNADKKITDALDAAKVRYAAIRNGLAGWESAGGAVLTAGDPSSVIDQSKVSLVTPDQFSALLKGKDIYYRLLDVRSSGTPAEGALHIPLADLESRKKDLPIATNIAVCGENGVEAFQAGVRLFELGFYSVKTLDGGCAGVAGK
ncbi:MAG: rhodanese-like domain-containing protein [Candidatus Moraniibacteriota bacterium]